MRVIPWCLPALSPLAALGLNLGMFSSPPQGPELIKQAGGLHGFMNWPYNLLTVSVGGGWHQYGTFWCLVCIDWGKSFKAD